MATRTETVKKWRVSLELAHDSIVKEYVTERRAREVYDSIVKALMDHKEYIDLGDEFVALRTAEAVRISRYEPFDPDSLCCDCEPYEPVAKVDASEDPQGTDCITAAERELFSTMLKTDGPLTEEKLVRRIRK